MGATGGGGGGGRVGGLGGLIVSEGTRYFREGAEWVSEMHRISIPLDFWHQIFQRFVDLSHSRGPRLRLFTVGSLSC